MVALITHPVSRTSAREVLLIVSIDTEEDNWTPTRGRSTVENIRELPRLERFFERLGVRATYLTTYQVARQRWAAEILLAAAGHAEVGAHLHPWNTPPLDEALTPRHSMLKNLPAGLQHAKLECLTTTLAAVLGTPPVAFRAGRYGLGLATVPALIRCGYRIDCSVTPFLSWADTDDGPNFIGAPLEAYRLGVRRDVGTPDPDGAVLEIPLSVGYSRLPFAVWNRVWRVLQSPALRPLRLPGIASRSGLVTQTVLSPELATVNEMLTLSRLLIERGVRHLQLTWHSPSLRPGLSPFGTTAAHVEQLYARIEAYLDRLSTTASVRFVTLSEAAVALHSANGSG